jgi:MFS superfamily sulfate permease-like transporter
VHRGRAWVETVLAGLAALTGLATAIYPAWFEALFGESPDAGSGAFEWAITGGLLVASLVLALAARRDFRRRGAVAR